MSGLSKNALEELSSERGSDDRVSHICNILRFAVLKKDRSCMAIGGRWNPADGGDPSVDDSPLVQTALRYGKDVAKLDLQNCKHWNRFLEIHYDRIGKDGVFSHKEVTVIFVPDLSECLPSLDSWRDQWLAHKKAVAERERQLSLKKERSREKEVLKDKEMESSKHKRVDKEDKKKESASTGGAKEVKKLEQDGTNMKGNASEGKGDVETAEVQTTGTVKTGKKKIIKKVVRQKVVGKVASDTTTKQPDNLGDGGTKGNSETPGQEEESSADPADVKTFVRKKVIKKVPVEKAAQNENNIGTKVKVENETGCSEDKSDPSGSTNTSVKTIVKKKIIKRVPKRKATGVELNEGVAKSKKDGDGDEKNVGDETESVRKQTADAEKSASDVVETEKKEDKKDEKGAGEKSGSVTKVEIEPDTQKIARKDNHNGTKKKLKDDEKTKDEKEKKDRDGKDESRSKSNKELKETRKPEEPPRHPGLILQTKWSKDSKLRSSSLSLDLLLDYTDKDIEESTFEISLFAETLYEKLQYQMGCRLLTFLQKLRIKFVMKRNQRKRQREVEKVEKGNDEKSPTKRPKINELPVTNQPAKSSEALNSSLLDGEKQDEEKTVKMEHIADDEEDPEEDPEEYEEMEDASPHPSNDNNEEGKSNVIPVPGNEKGEPNKRGKVDTGKKETPRAKEVVDKELLQAFRFFDRNQVGYVRVEDMRLIIHNLGKFLSHRDVKELVQSALLESNTGRDDHILYKKLVRMTDI
ncbi:cell division cycle and apoptosis regulator protein 1 [Prunus yedoensis var. nudiflora]|uniref:Cell division cycle and apoptosis regulator protein 1 n=1 Tax=Prunus yedoensis var. nudiflora TaxID=2094558 RepID=A0A314ZM41_PRUYE|nr:cell division cycle and apoptosis regulator protein 1 [Prunus yedoensis var. nudiflora]